jgi:hypothetical protein
MLECLLFKIGGLKHLCAFVKLVEDQWIYKFANWALVQCCSEILSLSRSNKATPNKARVGTHRAQRGRTTPHRTPGTCTPRFRFARQFVRCAPPHACAAPLRMRVLGPTSHQHPRPVLHRHAPSAYRPCRADNRCPSSHVAAVHEYHAAQLTLSVNVVCTFESSSCCL